MMVLVAQGNCWDNLDLGHLGLVGLVGLEDLDLAPEEGKF